MFRRCSIILALAATLAPIAGCGSVATIGATRYRSDASAEAVPKLSAGQRRRALSLLHASRALARLLHGVGYRVAHKGPWTTGGSDNRLIGAVFWLALDRPATLDGTWPTPVETPQRFPPYIERSKRFRATRVAALFVAVDLIRGAVVLIRPLPGEASAGPLRAGPVTIRVGPPKSVAQAGGPTLTAFYRGRSVTAQSGCLACHRIGVTGNRGPGPDLTHIGSTRTRAQIERAIVAPTAPMPSFRKLPKGKLAALVTFLALLR